MPRSLAFICSAFCGVPSQLRFGNGVDSEPQASEPTHANLLRGAYGLYRANNDLLYYKLHVRVDPEKFLSGDVITDAKLIRQAVG